MPTSFMGNRTVITITSSTAEIKMNLQRKDARSREAYTLTTASTVLPAQLSSRFGRSSCRVIPRRSDRCSSMPRINGIRVRATIKLPPNAATSGSPSCSMKTDIWPACM
ncbi:MAG: hypothetical protein BWY09_01782 [Candidatus Hydrogenedentes bacterium ADurb.Bin179]|nr:MAG: hypothetical protein BWY09_01782 [Candidatus Hydrogenedentes bacterium ADurb.Bin179]